MVTCSITSVGMLKPRYGLALVVLGRHPRRAGSRQPDKPSLPTKKRDLKPQKGINTDCDTLTVWEKTNLVSRS
jgi:hypothetical protein